MQKCAILIDQKKAKIRDQQRLLVKATVPPETVEEVRRGRHGGARSGSAAVATKPQAPQPSRKSKRKANSPVSSSSEDFEDSKDIKPKEIEEEQHPDSEAATPQRSDLDETADEASDGDEEVPAPATMKGKVVESAGTVDGGKEKEGAGPKIGQMPPKRDLPFQHKEQPGEGQKSNDGDTKMADNDDDEDDETDDEL